MSRIDGGLIDRTKRLRFTFDGQDYTGHPGDTLASALLANDVRLVGRSFKYHRPRGVFTSGSEEPNALVELGVGSRREPNTRATTVELFDGAVARSQNRWPSLKYDIMSVNDRLSPLLTAGFYYKTFMWPKSFWERLYEPLIRRAAGLGSLSGLPDPDIYDRGFLHCDLLIVGSGPAGLMAALTAARAGAQIIVAEEDFLLGGRLLADINLIDGAWLEQTVAELSALPNVRVMPRTTVFGAFDHGIFGAIERRFDHCVEPPAGKPKQTLWRIYAKRSLLCSGATERPIPFEDNDRPGIMLSGALRAYANRWGVAVARRATVFANNDDGLRTARDLAAKGIAVTLIDPRGSHDLPGVEALHGVVVGTAGRLGLESVTVKLSSGEMRKVKCGALGISGGWNPNVHMLSHHRSAPIWDEQISAFKSRSGAAGSAAGILSTHGALSSGARGAVDALAEIGVRAQISDLPAAEDDPVRITALWHVAGEGRAWLDLQNDVTVKDVKLAHQENFRAVEHLKRYTTLGMATDQGKTSNVNALAIMAELTGKSIPATGTTIYRPPYAPVSIGAFAGGHRGKDFRPYKHTPAHQWAVQQGASFTESGNWLRAEWFTKPGETGWMETVNREAMAVRSAVGICDVSTLGKIDIQGCDAAKFLDSVYCNTMSTLAVGRVRYGLMLREDGIVKDDGTAARLGPDHFVITTTTANAAAVLRHLEFCRQCLWGNLEVSLVPVTDAWAQFAVAGPRSRELLSEIVDNFDLSNEIFPFMACAELTICGGLDARLFRISFSGELAYELAVPARYGDALVRHLMHVGAKYGVTPYGVEALGVLRIEKGYPTGGELNGRSTALNLGLEKMVSKKKDAIGVVLSDREYLRDDDLRLVGIKPVNIRAELKSGSHLADKAGPATAQTAQGWVSSACYSPHEGQYIGLGFLRNGTTRRGETIRVLNPIENTHFDAVIVSPVFIDPEGVRLRA